MKKYELIVIGGGPAGMAAALAAKENNVNKILIIERDKELGGILNQCIHNGFGLHHFNEELTGPEYSTRVIEQVKQAKIDYILDTMVVQLDNKIVQVINNNGHSKLAATAIILAMGCRERTRGAINICGSRPAGIYTAGTAQRLINMEGYLPGKKAVVLGSGDIGLIMARRMTLEGAKVEAVLEILPHSNGLTRNIVQCLNDFDIPLKLNHTVIKIHGSNRVEGVTIAKVDSNEKPIVRTEKYIGCDTLLLSVGLIPETELMRPTGVEGIFACGNVLQVHDLVDAVSAEGKLTGINAAKYITGKEIDYVEPPHISPAQKGISKNGQMTCIKCPRGCLLKVKKIKTGFDITGNKCPRGKEYVLEEMTAPRRIVTSTVKITGGMYPVIPVKTAASVPKEKTFAIMKQLAKVKLKAPVYVGDIIVKNIVNTGIDVIATKNSNGDLNG